jgi:hypothetical protein
VRERLREIIEGMKEVKVEGGREVKRVGER